MFSANIIYYVIKYADLVTSRVEKPFQEVLLKLLRVIKTFQRSDCFFYFQMFYILFYKKNVTINAIIFVDNVKKCKEKCRLIK